MSAHENEIEKRMAASDNATVPAAQTDPGVLQDDKHLASPGEEVAEEYEYRGQVISVMNESSGFCAYINGKKTNIVKSSAAAASMAAEAKVDNDRRNLRGDEAVKERNEKRLKRLADGGAEKPSTPPDETKSGGKHKDYEISLEKFVRDGNEVWYATATRTQEGKPNDVKTTGVSHSESSEMALAKIKNAIDQTVGA